MGIFYLRTKKILRGRDSPLAKLRFFVQSIGSVVCHSSLYLQSFFFCRAIPTAIAIRNFKNCTKTLYIDRRWCCLAELHLRIRVPKPFPQQRFVCLAEHNMATSCDMI